MTILIKYRIFFEKIKNSTIMIHKFYKSFFFNVNFCYEWILWIISAYRKFNSFIDFVVSVFFFFFSFIYIIYKNHNMNACLYGSWIEMLVTKIDQQIICMVDL